MVDRLPVAMILGVTIGRVIEIMNDTKDKRPCPFCGNTYDVFTEETDEKNNCWQVVCMCCGAMGPSAGDAINAERYWNEWNERAGK